MVEARQGGSELVECVLIDWVRMNSIRPVDYFNLTVSLTAHRMFVCLNDRC